MARALVEIAARDVKPRMSIQSHVTGCVYKVRKVQIVGSKVQVWYRDSSAVLGVTLDADQTVRVEQGKGKGKQDASR